MNSNKKLRRAYLLSIVVLSLVLPGMVMFAIPPAGLVWLALSGTISGVLNTLIGIPAMVSLILCYLCTSGIFFVLFAKILRDQSKNLATS